MASMCTPAPLDGKNLRQIIIEEPKGYANLSYADLRSQLRKNLFFDLSGAPQWGKARIFSGNAEKLFNI